MTAENSVHDWIERLANEYRRLHVELVRTPSVVGSEEACIAIVRRRMQELEVFEKDVFVGERPPFVTTGRDYSNRPNLVGRIVGAACGPTLLLNAHIDTAPVEDESCWALPPFSGEIVDGKLFGRGALDDKAGVAMLLCLAEAFLRSGVRPPGDLLLEVVIEDEDSGNGTLACTQAGYHCDAAVIIDGTWPLRVIDAHLGQAWLDVEVRGKTAAACVARRGVNPIDVAVELIADLQAFVEQQNQSHPDWRGVDKPFFANVGRIEGGLWPGAIPERCRFSFQIGFPPPWSPTTIFEAIQRRWAARVGRDDRIALTLKFGCLQTPSYAVHGGSMIATVQQAIERVQKPRDTIRVGAVTGHCDLRHLRTKEGRPADACLYGPGGGGNPHVADEFYLLDHFVPVTQTIASAMLHWRR